MSKSVAEFKKFPKEEIFVRAFGSDISCNAEDISCQLPLLNPNVFELVNSEDSAVVAKLVYVLQDQVLYQRLLACRGTDAQTLLDLLQDVSNIMVLLPAEY
jgi:hypothetical protein